jgi:hypothetical protein
MSKRSLLKKKKTTKKWSWYWKKNNLSSHLLALFLLATTSLLSACGEQAARSTPEYFIPPTLEKKAEPIPLVTDTPVPPTATPTCEDGLTFIEDVTVPDGTAFAPGAAIEKIWRVANSGSCNWDADYRLRLDSGDAMDAETEQALFPARSNSEVEIRIVFKAPEEEGTYQALWQAYSPSGVPFGDPVFIIIEVDPDLEIQNAPTPTGETQE